MKQFWQLTGCITLAAFIGLSVLESFHTHKGVQSEANCTICQMAHQNPALTHPPAVPSSGVTVSSVEVAVVPHPYIQFVFEAHGRSPPAL